MILKCIAACLARLQRRSASVLAGGAIGAQTAKSVANANMSAPVLSPELQKVKAALDKYQDPVLAVYDGISPRWTA